MIWIIYVSDAAGAMSEAALGALLAQARESNSTRGITGMLLYHDRRFMQVLEGSERAVRERLDVIRADPRHHDLRVMLDEPIARRQFPSWTMGFPTVTADLSTSPGFRASFTDLDLRQDEYTVSSWALRELVREFRTLAPN